MKKVLLLHGPNLNLLGLRDKKHYGNLTLKRLVKLCLKEARKLNVNLISFQSNHEGALIDKLQKTRGKISAVIINPGALTHYSYALYDALLDTGLPCVEVHLSKIKSREAFRRKSVTAPACVKVIFGKKQQGYLEAIKFLSPIIK